MFFQTPLERLPEALEQQRPVITMPWWLVAAVLVFSVIFAILASISWRKWRR